MKKLLSAALLLCVIGTAFAQYPNKSIRMVVGFPPGGSADPTARIIGAALAEQLGQPVVVENRPGADSAVAALQVTTMPADGYNLFFGSNSGMTAAVALVTEQLLRYGYSPEASTPERLLEINREDLALWRKLIVEAKLPLE